MNEEDKTIMMKIKNWKKKKMVTPKKNLLADNIFQNFCGR